MKAVKIEFGIRPIKVPQGHYPSTYRMVADAINNIGGNYGIVSEGETARKYFDVMVPDWVIINSEGVMTRPGYKSKSGSVDRCIVHCANPIEIESEFYGTAYDTSLIDKAVAGGLLFTYPDDYGDMVSIKVECNESK